MSFRMRNPYEKYYKTPQPISVPEPKKNVTKNVTVKSPDKDEKNDQFSVGNDTIVFDKETGLWKIKK